MDERDPRRTAVRPPAGRSRAAGALATALVAGVAAACTSEESAASGAVPEPAGWTARVVATLGEKLGGCAVADVLPEVAGDEIVVCGVSGRVWIVARTPDGWAADEIGHAPGEMIQVAAGDVRPDVPGLEIIAVGMASGTEDSGGEGAVHVLARAGDAWTRDEIHRSPALVHAVALADLDGAPGAEVVVGGFAYRIEALRRDGDGWTSQVLADVDGAVKNLVAFGDSVAAACADGSLVLVERAAGETPDAWRARVLDRAPAGLARIGSDGARLLVARDDGVLALVTGDAVDEVHRESGKLRGAVIADLAPDRPGDELATAGYGQRVTILTHDGEAWTPHVVHEDDERLHHVAAGRVADAPGAALVACGYSGRVIVVTPAR